MLGAPSGLCIISLFDEASEPGVLVRPLIQKPGLIQARFSTVPWSQSAVGVALLREGWPPTSGGDLVVTGITPALLRVTRLLWGRVPLFAEAILSSATGCTDAGACVSEPRDLMA